ncbi:MAG: DHA1 family tetracycline resistance protein-like MFS transporter [Arenicella sp.]|jgi:DHA1 family tetracycline resistance protein-like MFS transporter
MNKRLLPAYLLTFVNVLGFAILMPVLPFIVEDYGAPKWIYGLLLTFYSAFQFLGSAYLGSLSDEKGRKPVLIISQAGTLLSWIVFFIALSLPDTPIWGFALPLWIIALSRILDGVTGGNSSVANAYVADITSKKEKTYIFGYLGGIAGLGMIIGPGIGGFTAASSLGPSGTIIAAGILSTITLITIFVYLKESHPPENRGQAKHMSIVKSVFVLKRIREANAGATVNLLFLLKFIFSIMMAFYMATIALFLIDLFEFNEKELGLFMLIVGVFLAFNQVVMSKFFISKFGAAKTLIIGLGLTTIGLFCITITSNIYLYCAFYYILNLGLSICFPTFNSLLSTHADPQHQGEVMGISESLNSLALATFPIAAAAIYQHINYNVYFFIAALPLLAFIIGVRKYKVLKA